jgi:hypothetical protein
MNRPGFTAEASLYPKTASYRASGCSNLKNAQFVEAGQVIPAFPNEPFCSHAEGKCFGLLNAHDPTAAVWCSMADVFCDYGWDYGF